MLFTMIALGRCDEAVTASTTALDRMTGSLETDASERMVEMGV